MLSRGRFLLKYKIADASSESSYVDTQHNEKELMQGCNVGTHSHFEKEKEIERRRLYAYL